MIKKTKKSELSEFGPSKYLDDDEALRFFSQSQQQLDEGMSAITPRTPLDPGFRRDDGRGFMVTSTSTVITCI
jgi:hypothetical protein